jgi:hypothetical protein
LAKSASLGGQSASLGGQSASFGGQSASLGGQSASLGGQSSPLVTFQDSNSFLGLNESSIIKKAKKSGCGSKDRLTCKFDKENEVEVERLTDGLCSVF